MASLDFSRVSIASRFCVSRGRVGLRARERGCARERGRTFSIGDVSFSFSASATAFSPSLKNASLSQKTNKLKKQAVDKMFSFQKRIRVIVEDAEIFSRSIIDGPGAEAFRKPSGARAKLRSRSLWQHSPSPLPRQQQQHRRRRRRRLRRR